MTDGSTSHRTGRNSLCADEIRLCVVCSHWLADAAPVIVAVCDRCKLVMRTARLRGIEDPHTPITTRREFWLPTTRFSDHEVSSRGRVRSTRNGKCRILRASIDTRGYPYVGPWTGNGNVRVRVHTLVLEAWCGPRSPGEMARHWDDRKTRNHIRNLAWGSRSDNMRDAVRNGRNPNSRKRKCPSGHRYTPENTRITPDGGRECRECHRAKRRRQRADKRRAAAALRQGTAGNRAVRHPELRSPAPRVTAPGTGGQALTGARIRREATA